MTAIAPTGTVAFMMDCDTTGIEPELALVKRKALSGGGNFMIVNGTVPRALQRLGYEPLKIQEIIATVQETGSVEGIKKKYCPIICRYSTALSHPFMGNATSLLRDTSG